MKIAVKMSSTLVTVLVSSDSAISVYSVRPKKLICMCGVVGVVTNQTYH